jgi:hypothetical protein
MPNNDWPPAKDQDLDAYDRDFYAKINANAALYGLLPADAAAMLPYVTAFTNSLALATDPATKTKVATMANRVARGQIVAVIRALAKRVQANNTVTAAAKTALGLPVHRLVPTPINPPGTRPMINVTGFAPAELSLRIVDESTPTRRARPRGTIGAQIFSFIGPAGTPPPADLKQWAFEGIATRADFKITYAPGDVGKQASLIARWSNAKGQNGPNSLTAAVPIAA